MRRHYLALHRPKAGADAARIRRLMEIMDRDAEWATAYAADDLTVWTTAAAPLPVQRLGAEAGVVIGEVFARPGTAPGPLARQAGPPLVAARALAEARWGQYVALLRSHAPPGLQAFRDPGGMVDCLTWSLGGGLEVVASDLSRTPGALRPRWPFLNWRAIATFVASPADATSLSLFDDIRVVGPGDLLALGAPADSSTPIWRPAQFVGPAEDLQRAGEIVRARVDRCTGDLVGLHPAILMELSGGLDSSILAGTLGAGGLTGRVAQWLNVGDTRFEGDETAYARAVTDRLGVPLTSAAHPVRPLEPHDLMELASEFWPAMSGIDVTRDRDEVARVRATGATGILSGQGGDAAFFQMPSALVVADELRRKGLRGYGSPVVADVARRMRTSVWAVLGEAREAERRPERLRDNRSTIIPRELRGSLARTEHAWVADARARGVSPGKLFHIRAVANLHANHGRSRRRREADLLMPLAAQPVLEACLSVATPDLAGRANDRPFARTLFADRVPEAVLTRRVKGNLSVYFSRLVAASLPTLRPFLLDGCLCEAGLLDRPALDRLLDPSQLIRAGRATDVLWAASTEAWVRGWQARAPDSRTWPRGRALG